MKLVALVCVLVVVTASCGADRTPAPPVDDAAAGPTVSAVAPTPPVTIAPTPSGPTPTPTPRIIQLPGTPSERAVVCAQAGLVAAGFDACLVYMGNGCTLADANPTCESARVQLDVVMGSRVFPTDCAELTEDATDVPRWCTDR